MSDRPGTEAAGPGRRPAGELEAGVLSVLWAAGRPLVPAAVHAGLGPDVAYTTVTTILHRLHHKGVVTRLRHGRGYAYAPAQDEATHTARAMLTVLRRGRGHSAVLARFLTELSPDDERLLQQLLGDTGEQQ